MLAGTSPGIPGPAAAYGEWWHTHCCCTVPHCSCYTVSQATRQTVDGLALTGEILNEHVCVCMCVCVCVVLLLLILLLSLLLILLLILILLSILLLLLPLLAHLLPFPLVFFWFFSFSFSRLYLRTNRAVWVRCCTVSSTSDRSHDNAQATATWTIHPLGKHVG